MHEQFSVDTKPEVINVCKPSPCGPNALCRVVNDSPSCTCMPEFVGAPPSCRPECISNSECPGNLACMNQKCRDPCPGSCGAFAECRVVSHTPMCVCSTGYTGDPFTQCYEFDQRETLSLLLKVVGDVWKRLARLILLWEQFFLLFQDYSVYFINREISV